MYSYKAVYFDSNENKSYPVEVEFLSGKIVVKSNISHLINVSITTDTIQEARFLGENQLALFLKSPQGCILDVSSADFIKEFQKVFPGFIKKTFFHKVVDQGFVSLGVVVLLFILLVLATYFWGVSFLASKAAVRMPIEYEEKLGGAMYENIIKSYDVDTAQTRLINDLASKINFNTSYKIRITVVHSDEKNAFAIPGGRIVVLSGILKGMKNYSELAALLGHEAAHVKERHTTKSLFRSLSSYALLSIFLTDMGDVLGIVLNNMEKFKSLSYSRELEKEADVVGLQTLYDNSIDPKGMLGLLSLLSEGEKTPQLVEFLSSHPITENRINYIKEKVDVDRYTVKENVSMHLIFTEILNRAAK